ncbi:MAG: Cof-type HAD-IIB family hydrolase [Coriobacteriales bacterium]|nr:Cof-type HAD-IIB family hydrolase [Coriobacteriales bacterium]
MYQAILLDIDGTLTNDQKQITPRTREALMAAQDKGVVLVLASGRANMGLTGFADVLDMKSHNGVFVCFNGAKAMNYQTGEVYFQQTLSVEQGKRVLEHMHEFDVCPIYDRGAYMYAENAFFTIERDGAPWHIAEYEAHNNNYLLCEVANNATFLDWEVNKILVAGQPEYLQQHWQQMAAPFEGELSSMFTAPFYYEFTPLGVDKTRALGKTFARLGISPAHTIAFGDAQNDLTMLQWAGTGVAMGNAVDEVRAAADEITLSNNEDGIAAALERLAPKLL